MFFCPYLQCQSTDEVSKLRKELQETLVVYDKACVDLVNVKKKVKLFPESFCIFMIF